MKHENRVVTKNPLISYLRKLVIALLLFSAGAKSGEFSKHPIFALHNTVMKRNVSHTISSFYETVDHEILFLGHIVSDIMFFAKRNTNTCQAQNCILPKCFVEIICNLQSTSLRYSKSHLS